MALAIIDSLDVVELSTSQGSRKMASLTRGFSGIKTPPNRIQPCGTLFGPSDTTTPRIVWPAQGTGAWKGINDSRFVDLYDNHQQRQLASPVSIDWLGRGKVWVEESTRLDEQTLFLPSHTQVNTTLDGINNSSYDPEFWLCSSRFYYELGISDTAVVHARKALFIIQEGLNLNESTTKELQYLVLENISQKLSSQSALILEDHLDSLHCQAYKALLVALIDRAAYLEGLIEVQKPLKLFPQDSELLEIRAHLEQGFWEVELSCASEKLDSAGGNTCRLTKRMSFEEVDNNDSRACDEGNPKLESLMKNSRKASVSNGLTKDIC